MSTKTVQFGPATDRLSMTAVQVSEAGPMRAVHPLLYGRPVYAGQYMIQQLQYSYEWSSYCPI